MVHRGLVPVRGSHVGRRVNKDGELTVDNNGEDDCLSNRKVRQFC